MKKALISLLLGVTLVGGLVSCGNTVSQEEYNELQENNKEIEEKLDSVSKERDDYKKLYEENKEEAKLYLELDDNEKQIVDAKIDEVNKATEEQLAQEKAQKEAEEKARKEEEERQKAEEEARKQEEQRKATEYDNVVKTARNYLNFMSFSRKGLIEQLVYEGYSTESAEYAVDNIGADWNEQCAKKAKDYLEFMSFSREGLYEQLAYEGFTDEQIQYGLSQVGY